MSAGILTIILASLCLFVFAFFLAGFFVFHNKKMIQNKKLTIKNCSKNKKYVKLIMCNNTYHTTILL